MDKTVHTISDMEDATAEHVSKLEDKVDSFFSMKMLCYMFLQNTLKQLREFYKYNYTRKFKENQRNLKQKLFDQETRNIKLTLK